MAKCSTRELKSILQAEKLDAMSAQRASKLSVQRSDATDYYMGDMSKDMPAEDGRSRAVSTDVADTIEGLMPSLMEIFVGGDEVVKFEPVGPEDEKAAEQETDYVNHVVMQLNPGFLALYGMIKDALMHKVGIVKVWWAEEEVEEKRTLYDIDDAQLMMLLSDKDWERTEHTVKDRPGEDESEDHHAGTLALPAPQQPNTQQLPQQMPQPGMQQPQPAPQFHDVTIVRKRKKKQCKILGVPPEEFGIARNARSLGDCGYCFHEVLKRQEELLADGYDETQIKALPTYNMLQNTEELSRDTVDEHLAAGGDGGINDANRTLKITEHYIRLDYERNGKVKLYRITTGGEQGEILKRDGEEEIIEEDYIPFAAMTPVIVTHRFFGRSIADLVMDIQRIKTALYRGILDNAYLANNPRAEVAETGATDNTLDDLLVSRPGGVVRVKIPGTVTWQTVPFMGQQMLPMIEYVDATREWRTGVSRAGQGLDANALQNQSATAANQLFTAAQARMKLIARIFAETGIRDLFQLVHAVIRKHGGEKQTVRLRNNWVPVDPREWQERNDMTVNVGLGTGSKGEQLMHLQTIIGAQTQAIGAGMVSKQNLYNSAKQLTRLSGFKNQDEFFIDPSKPPDQNNPAGQPIPPPQDPKQTEIAAKAQAEQEKIKADAAHQQMKTQADIAFQKQKMEFDLTTAKAKHDMDMQLAAQKHQMEMEKHRMDMAGHITKMATITKKSGENGSSETSVDHATLDKILSHMSQPAHGELIQVLHRLAGPKRIVRDHTGKALGVEPTHS